MKRIALIIILGVILSLSLSSVMAKEGPTAPQGAKSYLLFLDLSGVEVPEDIEPGAVLGFYRAAQRERFDAIVPWLLAQEQKGNVAKFELNFEANAVEVQFSAEATTKEAAALPGISRLAAANDEERAAGQAGFYELVGKATGEAAQRTGKERRPDTTSISMNVYLGGNYVWGYGPPSRALNLVLKNPNGSVKAKTKAFTYSSGYYSAWFPRGGVQYAEIIAPGDRIRATSGAVVVNWQVPTLTATANRATDVVSGRGMPNKSVNIGLSHYWWNKAGRNSTWYTATISTTATGAYSYDFTSSVNMKGNDYVQVYQQSSPHTVYRFLYAPGIRAWQGTNYVSGYAKYSQWVKVVLKNSSGATKAISYAKTDTMYGRFEARFYKQSGRSVLIAPNDRIVVSGPGIPTWASILPKVSASANPATGRIGGKAPAGKWAAAYHTHITRGSYVYGQKARRANTSGDYVIPFPTWFVDPGDFGYVLHPKRSGDQVSRPYLVD